MNYFTLLARLLLLAYGIFLLLVAIGEGITEGNFIYVWPPLIILIVVSVLWKRPMISALAVFILFISTTWYFKTYEEVGIFLAVSFPLAVACILFLIGNRLKAL
jgi:hypothetical protein